MMTVSGGVEDGGYVHTHARKISSISLLLLALAFVPTVGAQDRIGYVLDVKCDWFMNDHKLERTTPVIAGGRIRFQNTNQTNCGIVILNNNGGILAKRDCNRAGECDQPLSLPQNAPQRSVFSRVTDAVWGLLSSSPPEKYDSTVSRDKNLNEAIVQLKDGVIDLSPVFKGIEAGIYDLRLTSVSRGGKGKAVRVLGPVVFTWRPPQSQPLRVKGLTPGLYTLNLLDRIGDQLSPSDVEVWVLVSAPSQYSSRTRSFDVAISLTKAWGDDVKPDAKHTFLKTYLDYLSR